MGRQGFGRLAVFLLSGLLAGGLAWSTAVRAQPADKQLVYESLDRIEQLEQEVRQLRGDLEVYRHRQENLNRRLEALESGAPGGGARSELPSPETTVPPQRVTSTLPSPEVRPTPGPREEAPQQSPGRALPSMAASGSEQVDYDKTLHLLREGRFEKAIAGFQDFLRNHPDSPLAGNSQYWLGEAYYVTRDFDNAKAAFINLGVNYPNNEKLPEALLKLGNIYQELGDKVKAREVLQQLLQTYPSSQAAGLAQKRLSTLR